MLLPEKAAPRLSCLFVLFLQLPLRGYRWAYVFRNLFSDRKNTNNA